MNDEQTRERLQHLQAYLRETGFRPTKQQMAVLIDIALDRSPVIVQSARATGRTTTAVVVADYLTRSAVSVTIYTSHAAVVEAVMRQRGIQNGHILVGLADVGAGELVIAQRGQGLAQVLHLLDPGTSTYHHWPADECALVSSEMLDTFLANMEESEYRLKVLGEFP